MVFGALAAIFGVVCGKKRPTQVDCGRPPRPISQFASPGRQKRTKSTAKLLHR